MTESGRRHLDLNARIELDRARGDLGMVRRRLLSRISQSGYDAGMLARVGQVSFDMGDLEAAGRFWLVSDATGPNVEKTIEDFVRRHNGRPERIVADLPTFVRRKPMAVFPKEVQARLQSLGITDELLQGPRRNPIGGGIQPQSSFSGMFLVSVFVLIILASCILSMISIL